MRYVAAGILCALGSVGLFVIAEKVVRWVEHRRWKRMRDRALRPR